MCGPDYGSFKDSLSPSINLFFGWKHQIALVGSDLAFSRLNRFGLVAFAV
jgi:hypothetical protein